MAPMVIPPIPIPMIADTLQDMFPDFDPDLIINGQLPDLYDVAPSEWVRDRAELLEERHDPRARALFMRAAELAGGALEGLYRQLALHDSDEDGAAYTIVGVIVNSVAGAARLTLQLRAFNELFDDYCQDDIFDDYDVALFRSTQAELLYDRGLLVESLNVYRNIDRMVMNVSETIADLEIEIASREIAFGEI